jgi:hypothetical protein
VAEPPHRWWPTTPFGLGWFGHPQAGQSRGGETTPNGPGGGSATPWATGGGSATLWAKCSNFCLAQGAVEPPRGPLRVVRPPPDGWPGGGRTTPGQTGRPGTTYGVVRPPQHIFIYFFGFFFLKFFFLEKKNVLEVKWVKLLQFESLREVKCHILNFGGKSKNGWIFQEG